jgi:hypothetical protein
MLQGVKTITCERAAEYTASMLLAQFDKTKVVESRGARRNLALDDGPWKLQIDHLI